MKKKLKTSSSQWLKLTGKQLYVMNCVSVPLLKPQTSILWMEMFLNPSVPIRKYLSIDIGLWGKRDCVCPPGLEAQEAKMAKFHLVLCLVIQSCPTLCKPMDCSPPGSSVHGDSPGKNTAVGCHALLQGIFPIQIFHIAGRFPTVWATREAPNFTLFSFSLLGNRNSLTAGCQLR